MVVRWFVGLVLCGVSLGAQQAIPWATVDGGGATATTAGPYRLRGTIAQTDGGTAQTETGTTVRGGYWPGAVALSRLVFEDGFETGDTSAWSNAAPLVDSSATSWELAALLEGDGAADPGAVPTGAELGMPPQIPTLGVASLIAFVALLLGCGLATLRRRRST